MKKIIITLTHLLIFTSVLSQNTVTGIFTEIANTQIKLVGYNGFETYAIDSTQANDNGAFSLSFSNKDFGVGYLLSENNKLFVVILAENENLQLTGLNFELPESIKIIQGKQNRLFDQYSTQHLRREQCLSAWDYLTKIYKDDTLFSTQQVPKQFIETEKKRIKVEDSLFLANLPEGSYVSYYLPLRKLVSSVSTIAQYRSEEIPATIQAFRQIDYTDKQLYKSGMLKEVIESHFWLIENSGRNLDSVYIEMNISIDRMLENLLTDEQKLNEITEHLFKFLEKRSLFTASEYLALKLLNEKSCTLNSDFALQLENYRAMKKGNTAPDIGFNSDVFAPAYETSNIPQSLSVIKSNYIVVVFGASWCPQCPKELLEISKNYAAWKQQGVEVVFVSLDEDKQTFVNFTKPFSFISICDYKKWESPVVKNYHVFATPTIHLLNKEYEIILKPNSVNQLNSWIDWYLVQGNK
ncbi:MAG TPA: TlpA disulfide reductase family protein [Flavobacteriaceae bacterium]|nr:TlpA disulfide reductase family protein [Flavobacteriaceae bacterium]